ncbi:GNAT family N-acetyltransferase [Streptomyces sp. NPDC057638]|uniref:GNAT family N-acetyltransferase n=1 Tax=Streptomyces sp. NPDC057638 TaxID=3346190 RepID=UPI003696E6E9
MQIRQVPWDDPDATALRALQRDEIAEIYASTASEPGPPPSAADVAAFFVAYAEETPVACGGLRALDTVTGEVKRMYVDPAHRGSGAAALLLRAMEEWARDEGWSSLRIETGSRLTAAIRFYTRCGYARIPNYGPYAGAEDSLCFARPLTAFPPTG